ncbi:hypothetical protein IMG5_012080 [Ichthyophthirius multifiliis]|uniref:Ornithine decarboxylase antizyme n=1 Tax=Ichthyophthirius multifiliis TaxID=5932 RepID=G0QK29_ICHMU|nr:hypothetical protein IMG5_012080 [Ichthyophthirius multifiliis]EGR34431.1 hypothetical protein IMG5_012080 [Ichthyophthirius multifiliis]|eukprot:XP_004039735.1 hypothetical protein IMG5_012080 [Ichthyophthirius multifiliis]
MSQLINNFQQNNKNIEKNQDDNNLQNQERKNCQMYIDNNRQNQERKYCQMKGSFMITIGRDLQTIKSEPQVVEQQIEDEVLLTLLKLDEKNIIIYDIASVINWGDFSKEKPLQTFKCLYDTDNKNFYVELSEKSPMEHLTKSTFLKILDIAEQMGAQNVLTCLNNKISDINTRIQILMFVGFRKIIGEELKSISKTRTHTILCYDLQNE